MIHVALVIALQAVVLIFALRGASLFWMMADHPVGFPLAFLAVPALFAASFLIADAHYAFTSPAKERFKQP